MEQNKIQEMQFFQENLNAVLMQKRAFQMELNETISSLEEVEKSSEDIYKIVGELMLKVPKEKTVDELKNKEKILGIRLKKLEEQEEKLGFEVKKIREELIKNSKSKK